MILHDLWLIALWAMATLGVAGVSIVIGRRFGIDYIIAAMAGLLVVSNILAAKLVVVWNYTVPAGVLPFAATFLLTDLVAEKWGRAHAKRAVWTGFYAGLVVLIPIIIAVNWKAAFPGEFSDSFDDVIGITPRILVASFAAYIVSQNHDILAFQFWGRLTKGRHLWLRNNASTAVSQLLDTMIFIPIAFAGVPGISLGSLIIGQYIVKLVIAAVDTPLIYIISAVVDRVPARHTEN